MSLNNVHLNAHAGNCILSGKVRLEGGPIFLGIIIRLLADVFFFSFMARSSSFLKNTSTFSLRNGRGRFVRTLDRSWPLVSSSPLSSLDMSWWSISFLHLIFEDSERLHFSRDTARSLRFCRMKVIVI